ncbi:MAG: ABC transporter ATP-binding protein, partial [Anaerolineae bacterium]|nr:ABC transporter ATP-binding protein [Anaerolineae bacterium]
MTAMAEEIKSYTNEKEGGSAPPAWKVILTMVRFRPTLWLMNLGSMLVLMLFWQVPGLLTREFFNLLTGDAPVTFDIWAIIAFLFGSELVRIMGILGLVSTNVPFFVHSMTLLRKNLLMHILKRPGASALPDSPGEAISRFRGDVFEIPLFALWINDILGLVAFSAVAVAVMLSISVPITLLALAPFIFVTGISFAATNRIEKYRRASRRAAGIVTGFIGEFFGAVQAVKVATAEHSVVERFKELNDERRRMTLKDVLFNQVLSSIFRNAISIGTGVILIIAAQSMREGAFTVGDFALFVFYLDAISDLTAFAGLLIARYRQIGVSVERMGRLMEGAPQDALIELSEVYMDGNFPAVVYPAKSSEDHLRALDVTGLSYTYPGSEHGITGIDLRLERGDFVVITGRVGSGKTTLLRVLLGLLPKDAGAVHWNGEPVEKLDTFFVPPRCAYTAQVPRLFS